MSWLDVDEPEPVDTWHDNPYYHAGGVSVRHSPGYTADWSAPGYTPVPRRELSEAEKVLERRRQIIKDLDL